MKLLLFCIILLLSTLNINYINAATIVKHDFNLESQYASSSLQQCNLDIGIVLDDQYEITELTSPGYYLVGGDGRILYEGSKQVFRVQIQNVPVGTYNTLPLSATNSNGQQSSLTLQLPQTFTCKKLLISSPLFEYTAVSKFYYQEYFGYTVNIDFDPELPMYTFTCSISISSSCFINKYPTYFAISSLSTFDYSKINSEKITITIKDYSGGSKDIVLDNTIIDFSGKSSVIKSVYANPSNNSVMTRDTQPNLIIRAQVTFSELNSYQILRRDPNGPLTTGSLILGTPEEQILLFTTSISSDKESYSFIDYSPEASTQFTLNYTSYVPQTDNRPSTPTGSIQQSLETGNLLARVNIQVPELRNDIEVSPVYSNYYLMDSRIEYPYGISKSNQNSYCQSTTETLIPFTTYGGTYSISYGKSATAGSFGNYTKQGTHTTIPDYPGIITTDSEGPMVRQVSAQLLENNKFLFTMNITDVGTGLLFIAGATPSAIIMAKEHLVSGDINNGVYQFLINSDLVLTNTLAASCYDYMGNFNLNDKGLVYSDINLGGLSLFNGLTVSDITYFKFNRLSIDTSFNDLELILSIKYTGANEYSYAPLLAVVYLDMRQGYDQYQGVWNKTTEMFDIKINVQARERANFDYYLIAPIFAYPYQLEQLFPDQRVKLTSNYVDHYPPIITNLKSITNTQLNSQYNKSIELGWDIEIYDYPVGLDYAIIEVSSNKDFEPRVFNIKPDPSISGSDIKSTYPIRFDVSPIVDQVFFISKVSLYDKNGYFSEYPDKSTTSSGFNAFFNGEFTSERNISVTLDTQSPDVKAPQLLSLNFPTSYDSFGIDRVVTFDFSIKDDESGVSERHNPYVYIQFLYAQYYRVQSKRVNYDSATGISYYQANVTFDYGRLAHGAIVSIHGVVDNALNIGTYSSEDIKGLGFPSTMVNPVSTKPPVILENSDLNEDGGKFYIYGKAFGDSPVVYMNKGNGFTAISSAFQSNLAITLNIPSVKGISSVQFKVISNSKESNIITVVPIVNPVQVSDCSSLNDCSSNGECVNSKCICSNGYSGPDCSSTPTDITTKPNQTPSFGTFSSMIILNELIEIDINLNTVKSYPFTNDMWTATTVSSKLQNADAYQYVGKLGDTGSTITIVVDIFNQDNKVSFAGFDFEMASGTIKYTISLDTYPFTSRLNTLQLNVNASIDVADSKCRLNSIKLNENNCVEWIKLRSDDESLYGKFIEHALIDYRSVSVQNKLIVEPTLENQHAVIGIQIPYYYQTAVLDPDFSVLFDFDDLGKNKDSSCYELANENGNDKSGLSTSKIVGISVACGVVGIAAIFATVYVIKNNRKMFRLKKTLSNHN